MANYKVKCRIDGDVTVEYIQCREMTIKDGAYCFWEGEYGDTNKLISAYPVMFTIVTNVEDGPR
jgi:hypothetical protein